jgi:hypothetical protein
VQRARLALILDEIQRLILDEIQRLILDEIQRMTSGSSQA